MEDKVKDKLFKQMCMLDAKNEKRRKGFLITTVLNPYANLKPRAPVGRKGTLPEETSAASKIPG